jgi:hypothetical protein
MDQINLSNSLEEVASRTASRSADEAAHLQVHSHRASLARQVGQRTRRATSNAERWLRTLRTYCACLARFQDQGQCLVLETDIGQTQINRQRKQGDWEHGSSS